MTKSEKEMQVEELERQMINLFNSFCVTAKAVTSDGKEVSATYWNNARAEAQFKLLKSRLDDLRKI